MTRSDRARALAGTLLAIVALLAACDGGQPAPTPPGGAVGQVPQPALAGLYVTGGVVPVTLPDGGLRLISSASCDHLAGMLKAGQWHSLDELRYPEDAGDAVGLFGGLGLLPALVLQRRDKLAFATLAGGTACTATVFPLPRAEITLTGDGLPGVGAGWAATTRCYRSADDLTVAFYFDTAARTGGIGTVTIGSDGSVLTDETSITLYQHGSQVLREVSMLDWRGDAEPPSGVTVRELDADEGAVATATITGSAQRPVGTLTFTELHDRDGSPVALTVPFACAEVGQFG